MNTRLTCGYRHCFWFQRQRNQMMNYLQRKRQLTVRQKRPNKETETTAALPDSIVELSLSNQLSHRPRSLSSSSASHMLFLPLADVVWCSSYSPYTSDAHAQVNLSLRFSLTAPASVTARDTPVCFRIPAGSAPREVDGIF